MTTPQRRADAQSRLRKAHLTLIAARALLDHDPALTDDAVNRASTAALQAARALVDSQWARESQPGYDPHWRPGMTPPGQPREPLSLAATRKLLDRFQELARNLELAPDFTDYVRTLVEDGLDADWGELEYDGGEARIAIDTAELLIFTVAGQIGLEHELAAGLDPHDQPTSEHSFALPADEGTPAAAASSPSVKRDERTGPPQASRAPGEVEEPRGSGRVSFPPVMTSDETRPGTTTRRSARVHHEVMVGVSSEHGSFTGWGTNLSMGGVFVNSNGAPPPDTKVSVLLQLPGHLECKLRGRVARVQPAGPGVDEPGMGIEFVEPDAATSKLVGEMVEKLSVDLSLAPA